MGVETRLPVSAPGLPKTRAAVEYARGLHRGQVREVDGAPFIEHPLEVASLLYAAGAPDHLIAAGALHDVIEKTPATGFDLRRRFGSEVATLVLAVSEDDGIAGYTERKSALRHQVAGAGEEALLLYAADKISKTRELRLAIERRQLLARRSSTRRLTYYEGCLSLLEVRLPDSPIVAQLAVELRALRPLCRRGGYLELRRAAQ